MTVYDCHNHLFAAGDLETLREAAARIPLAALTVLSVAGGSHGDNLPLGAAARRAHPGFVRHFGAFDHTPGARRTPAALAAQVRALAPTLDGWKLIESKPDTRRNLGQPLDGPYYAEAFAALEALDLPVLWHVADPEEFWDPARTPAWARQRGWGYDASYPAKESLYAEVEAVLARHPRLRVVFAHFYFLSADLDRAARFLAAHPRVGLDLAPGVEMYYNLSRDRDRARAFFVQHADRIFFGTDAGLLAGAPASSIEARLRFVLRFLTTADEYRVPADADFLLGPPEDGLVRGLDLPAGALQRICSANYLAWVAARG